MTIKKSSTDEILDRVVNVEVGRSLLFEIVEEVDDFWISYDSEIFEGWKPPRSELKRFGWLHKPSARH